MKNWNYIDFQEKKQDKAMLVDTALIALIVIGFIYMVWGLLT